MKLFSLKKTLRAAAMGLVCTLPVLGVAQYQWLDKDGRKVFSDRSPPADIPAKNILRQPGDRAHSASAAAAAASVASAAALPTAAASAASAPTAARTAASGPKVSGKDKELEERKKVAEAAEAEKKKAEDEKIAKLKADNCARAKQAKTGYDSGIRIARVNAKGEREIIDDATRAVETKRLQGVIEADCKAV